MTKEWFVRVVGEVQGVGFRRSVKQTAERHHIMGYVRNCPDGIVEICAQASESEWKSFIDRVRKFPGIQDLTIEQRDPDEIFSSFLITKDL